MTDTLDFEVLAEDNVRAIKVPDGFSKKPLCVVLTGIPESGKTFLTIKLAEKFPLAVLSEEEMTAFLAPRATIFKRNAPEVFKLALKTIEHLLKKGKNCIYDANIKTREQRDLLRTAVEQMGGSHLLIHLSCPKETCYARVQKHNLAVTRGEVKGFIMDKDYFEYEVVTTHPPAPDEHHLVFDCQNPEGIYQIFTIIEGRLRESE